MLLLPVELLAERRGAASGPLAPLADSLAADLAPLLGREPYVPTAKALLSRAGGRCADDGAALDFDPFSPERHCCARCGRTYEGEPHHRWWVFSYQLWLAERAVHAALLYLLRGDERHGRLARDIAGRYAGAYLSYPNRDNVLGPTRLFFSTYLESIWLLQLCVAADLLETAGDDATAGEVRERIVRPSAQLIAQFDEGLSNRQVWHNAALMAAALLLGDRAGAERVVRAPSGVEAHLAHGLLVDGTWYEGENYHLFAHRGLWYCVTLAETAGILLDHELLARFQEGFAAPFATALPDFTFPSRKDSQYAVSLQQWRFAELCELGLAREAGERLTGALGRDDDDRLTAALARLYAEDLPPGDTGRARSTAEVERNVAPVRLARADLGWRSLLLARPAPPPLARVPAASACLEGQGITVFRRERGEVYVALDWGQSGGGHGHPDRLNVLFSHGAVRWLDDLGTGSYVDPSLHWYRSTLAHNAPLVNGHSQWRVDGRLVAFEDDGEFGWVEALVEAIAPGVRVERTLLVAGDYFVEAVRWSAKEPVRLDLPIHFDGELRGATLADAPFAGSDGPEDGFAFVRECRAATVAARAVIELAASRGGRSARALVWVDGPSRWFRAVGPGQPASEARPFFVVRCEGPGGLLFAVWSWSPRVEGAQFTSDGVEVSLRGARHACRRTANGWTLEVGTGASARLISFEARRPAAPAGDGDEPLAERARAPITIRRSGPAAVWELAAPHYRRSEETWIEAGRPGARVEVSAHGTELVVEVHVATPAPVFVPADAENPYDNEPADINGHGVQLYLRTPLDGGAWLVVPEAGRGDARVRRLHGWGTLPMHRAEWQATASGFALQLRIALPSGAAAGEYPLALDVLVNDTSSGRARRRGQLVLSGARGEFVYLRGDRHDPARLVPLLLAD